MWVLVPIAIIAVFIYWMVGVVVSVLTTKVVTRLNNHPRWQIDIQTHVKPSRVALLWVVFIPLAVVYAIIWLFTRGTFIAHKLMLEKWS